MTNKVKEKCLWRKANYPKLFFLDNITTLLVFIGIPVWFCYVMEPVFLSEYRTPLGSFLTAVVVMKIISMLAFFIIELTQKKEIEICQLD